MAFLDRLYRAAKAPALVWKAAAQAVTGYQMVFGISRNPPKRGTQEFLKAYSTMPWVRAATHKIASSIAAIEWEVGTEVDGNFETLRDHPMAQMLRNGSGVPMDGVPGLTGRDVLMITALHLELAAEAYWLMERNVAGAPIGILPLPPHWVLDIARPGQARYSVTVPNGGFTGTIPARDIVMFKEIDPFDPYGRGSAIVSALADELDADEFAAKYVSAFLHNRARPDIIVAGEGETGWAKDEARRMETAWGQKFGGPNRAGKPLFASGKVNVTQVGQSMRDNQMVELRQAERDIIISTWGIPPEKMGILANSNRSTIDAADLFFAKEVIVPRLELMKSVMQTRIAPEFDKRLKVRYDNPVDEDKSFKLDVMRAAPWHFTRDEWREEAEYGEAGDGTGEEYALPIGIQIAGPSAPVQPKGKAVTKLLLNVDDAVTISDALDDPSVSADVGKLVEAVYAEMVRLYGADVVSELSDELEFQITSRITSWARDESGVLISRINDTTRRAIQGALSQGLEAGEPVDALAGRIREVFGDASERRARLIAQTESTKAGGFASNEAFTQAGVTQRQWVTTLDGHARHTHELMNGQVRRTDQPFTSPSGATADYPGGFGIASEDIGCRCATAAYFTGQETSADILEAKWQSKETSRQRIENLMLGKAKEIFALQERAVLQRLNSLSGA